MFTKQWSVDVAGQRLTLAHDTRLSLRTRSVVALDGDILAQSAWRWNMVPVDLYCDLPATGQRVDTTVGYGRNGVSRVHSIRLDGALISGVEYVPDTASAWFPTQSFAKMLLSQALPATIAFAAVMYAAGGFETARPAAAALGVLFYWVTMGALYSALSKRVARDRARRRGLAGRTGK